MCCGRVGCLRGPGNEVGRQVFGHKGHARGDTLAPEFADECVPLRFDLEIGEVLGLDPAWEEAKIDNFRCLDGKHADASHMDVLFEC